MKKYEHIPVGRGFIKVVREDLGQCRDGFKGFVHTIRLECPHCYEGIIYSVSYNAKQHAIRKMSEHLIKEHGYEKCPY